MIGDLNDKQIDYLLNSQVIGRIGCSVDYKTYVVPISYVYDGTYIYSHTHLGLKIEMMRKNPKVCFEVDVMLNMANWQSAICWGDYEEITDPNEKANIVDKLVDRILPFTSSETLFPTSGLQTDKISSRGTPEVVFGIKLHTKTGKFEKR